MVEEHLHIVLISNDSAAYLRSIALLHSLLYAFYTGESFAEILQNNYMIELEQRIKYCCDIIFDILHTNLI